MIIVYVEAANIHSVVTNISLTQLRNNYIKAALDDPKIDLSKLDHYFLEEVKNEKTKAYKLVYDEEKYHNLAKEKEKAKAIEEGTKKLEEMQYSLTLESASDEDAYIMRYLYEEWKPKTEYKAGDRRMCSDLLYKCKQNHTSQEQYTPDLIPAIWDIINSEAEKGTKDNPIPVPEPFSSMIYVKGKYYSESGSIYLMNREGMRDGEEISLTFKPSQLVGHYFVKIN